VGVSALLDVPGATVPGAVVLGAVVLGTREITDLLPLAGEELAPAGAELGDAGAEAGACVTAGPPTGRADADSVDGSLDAGVTDGAAHGVDATV